MGLVFTFRLYLRCVGVGGVNMLGLCMVFRVLSRLGGKVREDEGAGQLLQLVPAPSSPLLFHPTLIIP